MSLLDGRTGLLIRQSSEEYLLECELNAYSPAILRVL